MACAGFAGWCARPLLREDRLPVDDLPGTETAGHLFLQFIEKRPVVDLAASLQILGVPGVVEQPDRGLHGTARRDAVIGCKAGTAPDCDDGVACTEDACDEQADACVNVPDNNVCDDGAWCNGTETCDAELGCQDGTAPDCDDDVKCTKDECDDAEDACVHAPDDSICNDGKWCNGTETCDAELGCQEGQAPDCGENDLFCDGAERCDETLDQCVDPGFPCDVETEQCDEEQDACLPLEENEENVEVPSNDPGGKNTGKTFGAGDLFRVNASGKVNLGGKALTVGPDGAEGWCGHGSPMPEIGCGALLGLFEGTDEPFFVGSHFIGTAPSGGELILFINDVDYEDNEGGFVVTVTRTQAPGPEPFGGDDDDDDTGMDDGDDYGSDDDDDNDNEADDGDGGCF